MPYVTDTHPLIWHMTNNRKLSIKAKRIFDKVDNGKEAIFIPCIVFFELVYLIEKKRVHVDFDSFVAMLSQRENYLVEPLCKPIIQRSRSISREGVSDPWDRLIVGTAMHLNLPLISRDESLRKIGLDLIW